MKKVSIFLLAILLVIPFSSAYIGIPGVDFVPNELIVKFKSSANIQNNDQAKSFLQGLSPETISKSERAFPVIRKINTVGLDRIYVIDFNPHVDIEKIIIAYKKNPNIEYVEPNWYGESQTVPNDPNYPNILSINQSGLRSLTPEKAWDYTTGSSSIVIANIDRGTNFSSTELASKIYINTADPINGSDDDNNTCIDDYYGCDVTFGNGANLNDLSSTSHGTRISSIFGALSNNAIGMAGTCWDCKIMIVKMTTLSAIDLSRGVRYAVDNNANVISVSTGFLETQVNLSLLNDTANYADSNNVVYVAAAGNQNNINPQWYPAIYPTVLGVAGLFDDGRRWSDLAGASNYGTWVGVSAPAHNVTSLLRNGNVGLPSGGRSGTSFAAPFVAGEAGLILSRWPGLIKKQVEYIIKDSVDNINASNPGFEGLLGTGRINLTKAMEFGCAPGVFLRTCQGPNYCDFMPNTTTLSMSLNLQMCGYCNDTDNGINENITGITTFYDDFGLLANNTDTCQNKNTVKEYYCASNQSAFTPVNCAIGTECKSGACVLIPPTGGSPFIFKKQKVSDIQPIEKSPQIFGFLAPIARFLRFLIPAI